MNQEQTDILIILKITQRQCTGRSLDISCYSSVCLHGTDPGMPLAPGSNHPPTSFPVTTFGISQLPWASRACQHHFLSLVLYYQLAVSSQIHQSCYTKMENMVNVPLWASHTSLSLGFYFEC